MVKLEMKKNKNTISIICILLLATSAFTIITSQLLSDIEAYANSIDTADLLQYEWPRTNADSQQTHFSQGPGPTSPDLLWERSDIYMHPSSAFNGKLFIAQDADIFALDPFTGTTIYSITVPSIPDQFTVVAASFTGVFKFDETHFGALSSSFAAYPNVTAQWALSCFNTADGSLVWTMDPQNWGGGDSTVVYVAEEKMAYIVLANETGRGSLTPNNFGVIEAWKIADVTRPPTLEWTWTADGTLSMMPMAYGDGKLFPNGNAPHQVCLDAKNGSVFWDIQLTGSQFYCPTYYEGMLLRGLLDNTFVALDGETGSIIWTYKPESYGFWSSGSAAAYGMVYMTNVDGLTYALNATNGKLVWTYEGPGMSYPGFPNIADGKIYVCTGQNAPSPLTPETSRSEFSCLDAYTGEVLWQIPEEFSFGPLDAAIIAYGNLYATNWHDVFGGIQDKPLSLRCYGSPLDWSMFLGDPSHTAIGNGGPTNPVLKWKFSTNGAVMSSPAVSNGKVYVGSFDKNWYCLDAKTGDKIWNFTAGYYIRSSPAVVNDKVYTGSDDGYVYCLDADTGEQIWKTPTPGEIFPVITGTAMEYRSSPTVADGKVYVGSLDGKLYCLNANTGAITWTIQTTGGIISSPTYISDDGLYFASLDGFVYKVEARSGTIIWNQSTPIGQEIAMMGTPAVGGGMVFIGSGAGDGSPAGIGQFYGLNATTGEFIWATDQLLGSGSLQPTWSMIYVDGVVYTADFFSFDALNATDGSKTWITFLTREHQGSPAYSRSDLIYVPSDSYGIYVLNASGGQKLAYFETEGQVQSSIAIWENKLYFGSNDWNVYCVEQSSDGTTYYDQTPPPSPTPEPTPTPTPQPTPTPTPTPTPMTDTYLAGSTIAIIVAIAIVGFLILRKK